MTGHDQEKQYPDAPWRWRDDWARGWVRGQSKTQMALAWLMAVPWNAFTWSLVVALWGNPDERLILKVLSLFCLAGLGLLVWAVRRTLAWFRFGASTLELASVPGVIGGTFEGRIHTRLRARPNAPLQLTLVCHRRQVTRSPRARGRPSDLAVRTDVLWQADRSVAVDLLYRGPKGWSIPVDFHIPFGLEGSDSSNRNDQILWSLVVAADLPGIDFRVEFPVPVFVTEQSQPEWTQERVDELAEQAGQLPAQPTTGGKSWAPPVVMRPTPQGGVEYSFRIPATLKTLISLWALAFGVCAGSALLFIWLEQAGPFALIPGLVGVLLLGAAITVSTFESRVTIEGGTVEVRQSMLGIPRTRRIPFADVKALRVTRETLEGVKAKDCDWEIHIDRHGGESIETGASIPTRAEARQIADDMQNLIG